MPKLEEFMTAFMDPESKREELDSMVQDVVNESKDKDSKIETLNKELEETKEKYSKLQERTMDALFNNSKGNPEPVVKKEPEPKQLKSFKDIIPQDAPYNIK